MTIVRKKIGIGSKNKKKTIIKSQYGGGPYKVKFEQPKAKQQSQDQIKANTNASFGKKPSFFSSLKQGILNSPKNLYAGVGALKNGVKTGLTRFFRKNPSIAITKKIDTKSGTFSTKLSTIAEQIAKKTGQPAQNTSQIKNPYEIAKRMIEAKTQRDNLLKQIKSTTNLATVSDLQKQLDTHQSTINTATKEKQQLLESVNKEDYNPQIRSKILKALGKIDSYNTRAQAHRDESGPMNLRAVLSKSYQNTKTALGTNTLKTIGSSFVPSILRRAYTGIVEGKKLDAFGTRRLSGLGRKVGRSIINTVPFFRKKSIKTLSERLATDTADINKIGRDTKIVLTNIKNMTTDLENLKGKTDSLSIIRRDELTAKISEQKRLLTAYEVKSIRMKKLVNATKANLEKKTKRKEEKLTSAINKSKNSSKQFLGSINSIRSQLTNKDNPNSSKYTDVESLLKKMDNTSKTEDIVKDITREEVSNAYSDISNMLQNINKKMATASDDEKRRLQLSKDIIINQGTALRKLLETTRGSENSKLLTNKAQQMRTLVNRNHRIIANNIVREQSSYIPRSILKSIPLLSGNTIHRITPNKNSINSALQRYSAINTKAPIPIPQNVKNLIKSDKVLEPLYLSNPEKFNNILSKASGTDLQKIDYIKTEFGKEIKNTRTNSEKLLDLEKDKNRISQEIDTAKTTGIAGIQSNIDTKLLEQEKIEIDITKRFTEPLTLKNKDIESKDSLIKQEEEKKKQLEGIVEANKKTLIEINNSLEEKDREILSAKIDGKSAQEILQLEAAKTAITAKKTSLAAEVATQTANIALSKTKIEKTTSEKTILLNEKQNLETNQEKDSNYLKYKNNQLDIEKQRQEARVMVKNLELKQERLSKLENLLIEHEKRMAQKLEKNTSSTV